MTVKDSTATPEARHLHMAFCNLPLPPAAGIGVATDAAFYPFAPQRPKPLGKARLGPWNAFFQR